MEAILKRTKLTFSAIRLAPHLIALLFSSEKKLIWADLDRFGVHCKLGKPQNLIERLILFIKLMTLHHQYRNVFYLRIGLPGRLLSVLCPRMTTLAIAAKTIGPGLFVQHGHGTFVSAAEIGRNCTLYQLVTIGFVNEAGPPTIGNDVIIHTGATILGKIHIGDNSTIGANSLVLRDVPPNVTVLGSPAKIISRKKANSQDVATLPPRACTNKPAQA